MGGILVVLTLQGGAATPAGLDLLGLAAEIAQADGGEVTALALGEGGAGAGQGLISRGADAVLYCADPALARHPGEAGMQVLAQAEKEVQPDLLLLAADSVGRDLGPRIAARLGAGLVTEATSAALHAGRVEVTRPVFGGKAIARMAATTAQAVITLRPGAGAARAADPSRTGTVRELAVQIAPAANWPTVVRREVEASSGPRLEEATAIVSGGRGVGGPEGFSLLHELAQALGGAVGASRAAVDAGWARPDHQVGLTGQTVAPDVYLAIGISGASQHLAGMSRSHVVLAVNTDRAAPMADAADVAFIGDWHALWPFLEELLSSRNPEGPVVTVMGDGTGWSPRGGTRSDHDGAGPIAKDGSRGRS